MRPTQGDNQGHLRPVYLHRPMPLIPYKTIKAIAPLYCLPMLFYRVSKAYQIRKLLYQLGDRPRYSATRTHGPPDTYLYVCLQFPIMQTA